MVKADIESVKATIAKLITLANNAGATENEKFVAMDRAKALMTKYQLDQAEVLRQKIKTGVDVEAIKEDARCYYTGKLENWEFRLGWRLGEIFECYAIRGYPYYDFTTDKKLRDMSFVGLPSDISLVLYFFDYCQNEIARHMELAYPTDGQKVRNSFALGMVMRIVERMKEFYTKYKEEIMSSCTDIVIYKEDAINKKKNEAFPNRGMVRLQGQTSSKDYLKGRAAGEYVHLSSNLRQAQEGGE